MGSVWVVTGGARGVTAVVARELGRRFGVKLHLVGSSVVRPIDPRFQGMPAERWKGVRGEVMDEARRRGESPVEAWEGWVRGMELDRSLREFEAAGVKALYHTCDISDSDAVATLIAKIRSHDGVIGGVIHGAGVEMGRVLVGSDRKMSVGLWPLKRVGRRI